MSIIAGVLGRQQRVSDETAKRLIQLLAVQPNDVVDVFERDECILAKVDYGIFGSPAFRVGPDSATVVAGQPRLDCGGKPWRERAEDVGQLGLSWDDNDESALRSANGVFCAAHYNSKSRELVLAADKLGIRPLYYWVDTEYVVFASALWILQQLPIVPKRLNIGAIAELSVLTYAVGDATPYKDIRCLRPAETVRVSSSSVHATRYWRWDHISSSTAPEDDLLRSAGDAFAAATTGLVENDRAVCSFLSGGMDSRCVAAALRDRGIAVHAFTFARQSSQELAFAHEYAKRTGVDHHVAPYERRPDDTVVHMLSRWLSANALDANTPERKRIVWAGDGGSVGLGSVYMTEGVVQHLRAGDIQGAVQRYIADTYAYPAVRLLSTTVRGELRDVPARSILEEINGIEGPDPVQRFFLFLMFNDQRRHLYGIYEDIHDHRIELALPFFDSAFMHVVTSVPIELRLFHKFYAKWIYMFDPATTSVPWQTYPGHVPCAVPKDETLNYQWTRESFEELEKIATTETLREMERIAWGWKFPRILNRKHLLLSTVLHRAGVRNYGYQFKMARKYVRYWRACNEAPETAERVPAEFVQVRRFGAVSGQ